MSNLTKQETLNGVLNTIIEGLKRDLKNEFRTDNIYEMNKMIIELTNQMKQNNQPDNVRNNTPSTTSNLTKKEKKEHQAIMKAMNIKRVIIPPPEYNKIDCSICLKKIHKGEQKTLECGHMFHSSCILKWALKTANDTGLCECQRPTKNRQINLFKEGENIFTCPCCRVEHTTQNNEVKRVLAKVHIEDKGKCLIHYVTNDTDIMAYVPLSEISNNKMSGKWAMILSVIKTAWEQGDTNIYAMYRLRPEPEFVLSNSKVKTPPLDKITGQIKKELFNDSKALMVHRMVNVDELNKLLNDI